ncbi:hypothetical protein GGTG_13942 [Gaeumannomyces tritici R3-111a-1]|uniref:ML-like domain-containing protein n=1 Tax=Gaeumannomyces tritici (strain R3-111a-1) TaxID=644352 RepID=J3PK93_GAET3|nr:hypothetical protein GGTG_13942 [Gaeumannomyces tritici R3-111a-1]EJT68482.1 hypothetical protein GGTG_13942 [Gaeumannomyces tritici R3-111a-1]
MFFSSLPKALCLLPALASLVAPVAGERVLKSTSLSTCQENSAFSASLFDVAYYPDNQTAMLNVAAMSSVEGKVIFDASVRVYGYEAITIKGDPCTQGLKGLCPMTAGKIPLNFPVNNISLPQIPNIAYTLPDLDAKVRVYINLTEGPDAGKAIACVEAYIVNGKTVDLLGVKWATAIVSGLALTSSAVVNGLGHSNAASHVAANALSLFGYFQAQAMLGLTSVPMPPVVRAWTQNFQWSMGIIRVQFMQDMCTWYQRATGGTPATLFDALSTVSVEVQKRSLDAVPVVHDLFRRSTALLPRAMTATAGNLFKRANIVTPTGSFIVFGIQRVAFKAGIETTNLFLTGLSFFVVFVILVTLSVAAFKGFCEVAAKKNWMKHDTFLDFRNGWLTVLKGILFRVTLIGFPQMSILCLWEFTQVDSPAIVVLAVFFLLSMMFTLGWAASKVIRIARRSVAMHRNPAYILFSDPQALNKWGFLYVQFRASAYYFIVPYLLYIFLKAMFVAFAQKNGTVQAVAFVLIEAGALIAASVLRPWMDKSTNSFNIAICVINFLNAIFLLIFTGVFGQPPLATGVVGVFLWISNAAFALVLLIMLIVTTAVVLFRKNPDTRYQAMADDRTSFMKSQTQLTATTELDALAATARGDKAGYNKNGVDLDDDNDSLSSGSMPRRHDGANPQMQQPPRSPVDPSVPLFPADARRGPQQNYAGSVNRSPSPYQNNGSTSNLSASGAFRAQNNASPAGGPRSNAAPGPWQRGAGYD